MDRRSIFRRNPTRRERIADLLRHLETLERSAPTSDQKAIVAIARDAIVDELTRLSREDWLSFYRRGDGIDAVSMAG